MITKKWVVQKDVDESKGEEKKEKKKVTMRLCHPPDGSTSPKYKLLCFKPPIFLPNTECTSF
jgi:hypothetical protein